MALNGWHRFLRFAGGIEPGTRPLNRSSHDVDWLERKIASLDLLDRYRPYRGSVENFRGYLCQVECELSGITEIGPGCFSPVLAAVATSGGIVRYEAYEVDRGFVASLRRLCEVLEVPARLHCRDFRTCLRRARRKLTVFSHSIDDIVIADRLRSENVAWKSWNEAISRYCSLSPRGGRDEQALVDWILDRSARSTRRTVIHHFVRPDVDIPSLLLLDRIICDRLRARFTTAGFTPIRDWNENYPEEIAIERVMG